MLGSTSQSDKPFTLNFLRTETHPLAAWDTIITGFAHPKNAPSERIGTVRAHVINRPGVRSPFHHDLDTNEAVSRELKAFVWMLYDNNGFLKPWFVKHNIWKGSGIWGDELGHGGFMFIEELGVEVEHRRKGVGKSLVEGVLARAENSELRGGLMGKQCPWAFVPATSPEMTTFFQKMGFRRVGRSPYLAYAFDKTHAARKSDASVDAPPLLNPPPGYVSNLELHETMRNLVIPDEEVLAMLSKANLSEKDNAQETLLHLAAKAGRFQVVEWLLGKPEGLASLVEKNCLDLTPVEDLELEMANTRERHLCYNHGRIVTTEQRQFVEEQLKILRLLKEKQNIQEASVFSIPIVAGGDNDEGLGEPAPQTRVLGCDCKLCKACAVQHFWRMGGPNLPAPPDTGDFWDDSDSEDDDDDDDDLDDPEIHDETMATEAENEFEMEMQGVN